MVTGNTILHMIVKTGKYLLAFLMVFALTSCEEENPFDLPSDRLDYGTYRGELKGDLEADLFGAAYFSRFVDDLDNPQKFAYGIYLESGVQGNSLQLWFARGGDVPEDTTYSIEELKEEEMKDLFEWIFEIENFRAWIIVNFDNKEELYFSDNGSITIEATSDVHSEGSFEFTATGYIENEENGEPEEVVVEISGEFLARQGDFSF